MLFLLIFLLLVDFSEEICPNESIEWQSRCYFFNSNQSAFIVAEETCVNLGGHLTSVHDGFVNQFLAQNAALQFHESTVTDFWIGGSDLSGNWTWTDGSNFTFTEWGTVKNLTGEDCISEVISTGKWSAEDCFKQKPFVCAAPPISTQPPTTPPTTNPPFVDCGYGWIYFEKTGCCYGGIVGGEYTWVAGEIACQQAGAHLVSVHSDEEYTFLASLGLITWRVFWIGLYSNDDEHTWHWSDGTLYDYTHWAPGNPKLNKSACVYMAGFVDDDCSALWYPICKKKL